MPASQVRDRLSETIDLVAHAGERIILERHNKPAAALVPIADLELILAIEDRIDLEALRAARNEESIPWEQVEAELGL